MDKEVRRVTAKACSDFLKVKFLLKATYRRELVAAFFGYKTHAALLADDMFQIKHVPGALLRVAARMGQLAIDEYTPLEITQALAGFTEMRKDNV